MPTNRKFVRRHLRRELTWAEEMELWLGPSHRGSLFASREELFQAWLMNRDQMMAAWAKHGKRPAGWWEFEAPFPRPSGHEQSALFEAGLLSTEERIELLDFWRRQFERAFEAGFVHHSGGRMFKGAPARRAHYRWADIPKSLLREWTAQRRDDEKGVDNIHTLGETAEHPESAA